MIKCQNNSRYCTLTTRPRNIHYHSDTWILKYNCDLDYNTVLFQVPKCLNKVTFWDINVKFKIFLAIWLAIFMSFQCNTTVVEVTNCLCCDTSQMFSFQMNWIQQGNPLKPLTEHWVKWLEIKHKGTNHFYVKNTFSALWTPYGCKYCTYIDH